MYKVYKHENLMNGKVYIGITGTSVERRWGNGGGYAKSPLFWKAIQKYGWDSFSHEVLWDGLAKDEAERKEIELISFYKSNDPQHGYNIQSGGNAYGKHSEQTKKQISESNKGRIITAEMRQKISNSLKGRTVPVEVRQKISESTKGEKAYWYGKPSPNKGRKMSEAERKRRSDAMKGRTPSEETRKKISESLKGEKSPWYGRKHTEESIDKMRQSATNKRCVRCIETGVLYGSIREAGDETSVNYRNIHSVCVGKRNTAGGLHWEYAG